jgi:hypothetical protein
VVKRPSLSTEIELEMFFVGSAERRREFIGLLGTAMA